MIKTRQELIKKYIQFFKKNKHKEIPNSSLIPSNDPTVLFTTAGMHPLVPYLTGQKHPLGKRLVNVQKCIRTGDIDEVGDLVHGTFFEMLGNWSLGDYWKEEAISLTLEFLTSDLKIPKAKLAITCYKGDKSVSKTSTSHKKEVERNRNSIRIPRDTESAKIWNKLGIPSERIAFLGKEDNWWGPAGLTGPCGPDTEIFYSTHSKTPKKFNPSDSKWIEIGNNVFMEYNKSENGSYIPLAQKTVDFGGGLIRQLAILNNLEDIFQTSAYLPIIKEIEKISKKPYKGNEKSMRIIADHIKASIMILSDDHQVKPSNVEHGYVLRRLIRRAIRHGKLLGIESDFTTKLFPAISEIYSDYKELKKNKNFILSNLDQEEEKFRKTLQKGLSQFNKLTKNKKALTGKDAFLLFQSYGFPIEMALELAKENKLKIKASDFEKELQKHRKLSQAKSAGKFTSGLADQSEQTTKLHTATHLLNEALRSVLGPEVKQRGSNITPERLRFDFNFPRALSPNELKKAEELVNQKIKSNLTVVSEEMSFNKALDLGAQAEFGHKYPPKVSVYTILDPKDKRGWFSKEICTGPHVSRTGEIGTFKIVKEQSSAAGVRRIKAVIEN